MSRMRVWAGGVPVLRRLMLLVVLAIPGQTQSTGLVSGGLGWITSNDGGVVLHQPVFAPVFAVPVGSRILVESRLNIQGVLFRERGQTGPYTGIFLDTIDYLQADVVVNKNLTLVAGRFLTPFGIYNERLTPIWIHNLQALPTIVAIGTRTTGASNGVMLRGVRSLSERVEVNYTGYVSAKSEVNKFEAARSAGGRGGLYFRDARLELGGSYSRFLQDRHYSSYGVHGGWQPPSTALDVKGEYANSYYGKGYWLETAYRLSRFGGEESLLGRLQLVGRGQQFYPSHGGGSSLPRVSTHEGEFGVNYYLPHEVRLSASGGRVFTSPVNRNSWTLAITYRFLLPLWPGRRS